MTEYQERRAQYLRDAHDWAEDDLPDASADYITVQDIAKIYEVPIDLLETAQGSLEHAEEIRQAYQRGRADGAAKQRGMDTTTLFRNGEMRAADILDACPLAYEDGARHAS